MLPYLSDEHTRYGSERVSRAWLPSSSISYLVSKVARLYTLTIPIRPSYFLQNILPSLREDNAIYFYISKNTYLGYCSASFYSL